MTKEELKNTDCWKCVWKSERIQNICPYQRYYSNGKCQEQHLSSYWRNKERKEEQAKRLGELILQNGITPKYKLGDTVYIRGQFNNADKTQIRRIDVNPDGTSFQYKVKGHTEYSYDEKDVYPTEAECYKVIIENWIKETISEGKHIIKRAQNCGLEIESLDSLLIEDKTNKKV